MSTTLSRMMQLGLLAVAITVGGVLLLPAPSRALQNCAGDRDCDGLTDAQESATFTLTNGMTTVPLGVGEVAGTSVPTCTATDLGNPNLRRQCLDPATKDLFVILNKPATGSNINTYLGTADPLAVLRKNVDPQGGLGIAIHQVTDTTAKDRKVTTTQKAIRITESLSTTNTGIANGSSSQGTPNGTDLATVWTQKIVNLVNGICAGKTCVLSPAGSVIDVDEKRNVIANYIQDTIAHEASHVMYLTTENKPEIGGNHYITGTNTVMDQTVWYDNTTNPVIWYLPNIYAKPDPGNACLTKANTTVKPAQCIP